MFEALLMTILIAVVIVVIAEWFSPDARLTWIVRLLVFVWLIYKLLPFLK
jgi:hypothetical protein